MTEEFKIKITIDAANVEADLRRIIDDRKDAGWLLVEWRPMRTANKVGITILTTAGRQVEFCRWNERAQSWCNLRGEAVAAIAWTAFEPFRGSVENLEGVGDV